MLCVIPIILSLAFLSYDLLSALFFHQRNSKELDGGCTYLPTYLTYPGQSLLYFKNLNRALFGKKKSTTTLKHEAVKPVSPGSIMETQYFTTGSSVVLCDTRRIYVRQYINIQYKFILPNPMDKIPIFKSMVILQQLILRELGRVEIM